MNYINRHNYEKIFLLYVDNELSATERNLLAEFVKLNPDLEEELNMLKQTIIKPEHLLFSDKHSLLKDEIVSAGLQEKLLLFIDNELGEEERKGMEQMISSDEEVWNEWNLLQQTFLSPDNSVVYTDKTLLYRTKGATVIDIHWRSIAAAAIFIGLGLWGAIAYYDDAPAITDKVLTTGASNKAAGSDNISVKKIVPPLPVTDVKDLVVSEKLFRETIAKKTAQPFFNGKQQTLTSPGPAVEPMEKNISQPLAKSNNLPKPLFENLNNGNGNKSAVTAVIPVKPDDIIETPGNNDIVKIEAPGNFASSASFAGDEPDDNSNVSFFEEEEDKTKKTRLGGLLRKVKRVLNRNTTIKMGDKKFKVANLEFVIQ